MVGQLLECGRINRTAEGAGCTESNIIEKNQDYIWRTGVCLGMLRPVRF
jgi:hypothetical protein